MLKIPFRGFLPSTGRLLSYEEPCTQEIPSVRCDSGILQGSEVSMFYDPMISKLCTYRETRTEALDDLATALDSYVIQGVGHNINFLRDVCRDERFRSGKITTGYIAEEYPDGFHGVKLSDTESVNLAAITAAITAQRQELISQISGQTRDPTLSETLYVSMGERHFKIQASDAGDMEVYDAATNELLDTVAFDAFDWDSSSVKVDAEIGGSRHIAQLLERTPSGYKIQYLGAIEDCKVFTSEKEYLYSKYMLPKPEIDMAKWLLSPMPGALVSVSVEVGQEVFPGQELAVVEAMKMQNVLSAERKGVVKSILSVPGATLSVDQEIIEFE